MGYFGSYRDYDTSDFFGGSGARMEGGYCLDEIGF